MSKMIFDQYWSALDATKIEERVDPTFGPVTVFRDVVIAREIIQPYNIDGKTLMAYKSADELERYWPWVDGRWAIAGRHPSTPVIVSPGDIAGRTVNPRFVKNLKDHSKTNRPNIRGILVDLEVFNNRCPPDILKGMKDGSLPSVSIGFLYGKEMTPGNWNGQDYDFRQVNMFHDHTAYGIMKGRCSYPACGIGADQLFNIENSLYGVGGKIDMTDMPWEETDEYIRSGHGSTDCDRMRTDWISEDQGIKAIFCFQGDESSIQSYLFSKEKGWTMEKAKTWFEEHEKDSAGDIFLNRLIELQSQMPAGDQEGEGPRTDDERAMAHYSLSEEVWDSLSAKAKSALIAALPDRGAGGDEMTEEELKAKIAEIQKQIDEVHTPTPEAESEKYAEYEVLWAEMQAYKEALTALIKAKALGGEGDMPEDDPGFQACVDLELSKGKSQEEAEAFCRDKAATPDPQPDVTMSGDEDEVARSKRLLGDPRFKVNPVFE